MNTVTIQSFGDRYSHIADNVTDHATLCGMDGDDENFDVRQKTVATGEKVNCPHCLKIWLISTRFQERHFERSALAEARRKLAA
jgi:hypothetical protein